MRFDFSGDVIISQEPYVCVPNNSSLSTPKRCDGCFTTSNALRRCSRCHVAYYCGSACQVLSSSSSPFPPLLIDSVPTKFEYKNSQWV